MSATPANRPFSFRNLTPEDLTTGLALCRASGWNQVHRDWMLFLELSPAGCRAAVKDGRVVGTVTTVRYEDRFSWIGMVLVDPEERRQGIGTALLHEGLDLLKDMQSVRLDATPAGRPIYHKLGFLPEYGLRRMEGVVGRVGGSIEEVRPMKRSDLPAVYALDREVFGASRQRILESLLAGAPDFSWVLMRGETLEGFTLGRHGYAFEHVGPVIARDAETARRLVTACLVQQAGKVFILDAPDDQPGWQSWLETLGFREQRPFTRMYRGANPYPGVPGSLFAILGPEFG